MITLYHGDCLKEMSKIPDGSVDMILTSPPYDDMREYGGNVTWNYDIFVQVAEQCKRVLKPGGVIVWIVGDETKNGSESGSSFRHALFWQSIGLNIHDTMIWNKAGFTATGSLKVRYASVFEYMFVLSKGKPKTFNPIKDRKNKWAGTKNHGTIRQKNGNTKETSCRCVFGEYGQRFNVWECPSVKSSKERCGHPAPFPIKLAQDHVISWSNAGDIVLDMFMGSGSTGVACVNTGRRFIGIEMDDKYFAIAQERINKAQEKLF